MLALQITSLKPFMNALLVGDLFDIFLLEKAEITTAATYTIDGRINKAFYSDEDFHLLNPQNHEFAAWTDMKGICFELIKGKRTPLHFQFVFHLQPKHVASILRKSESETAANLIKAFVLTVRYDGEKVLLCTGTSFTTFVMDKEPEKLWDAALMQYLFKKGIACEEL